MAGYVRQEAANIVTSATIEASHLNNEFNQVQSAFDKTSGHDHDGTVGGGAPIALATAVTGTLAASNGGTGATTLTDGGVLLGSGTGAVTVTAQPTNGQLVIGSTGVDPVLGTLTDGTYVTATEGAGTITVEAAVTVVASVPTDTGTATATANAVTIAGGEGIDTSASGTTVTIAGEDATSANKGIATFNTGNFAVTAGDVTIKTDGVTATELADNIQIEGYRPIITQAGTAFTFALTDADSYIRTTNASAVTVTVPLNSAVAFTIGAEIDVIQAGAGQVTFAATGGVTINSDTAKLAINVQFGGATLKKVAADEWDLVGNLV